jgi:ABC-type multidrug transport system fused ATPase/permease subunit
MSNTIELTQRGIFKGERQFEIRDNRYLSVSLNSPKGKTEYLVDLVGVSPVTHARLSLAWNWFSATLISLILLLVVLFLLPEQLEKLFSGITFPLAISIAFFTLLFSLMSIAYSRLERVFCSTYGNFPVIKLLTAKPDRKSYNEFIKQVIDTIEQLNQTVQLDDQKRIAGEIKMLRRLIKHNVLNEPEYEKLKSKLFKMANG